MAGLLICRAGGMAQRAAQGSKTLFAGTGIVVPLAQDADRQIVEHGDQGKMLIMAGGRQAIGVDRLQIADVLAEIIQYFIIIAPHIEFRFYRFI